MGITNRSQVLLVDAEGDVMIGGLSSASDQLHVAGEARVLNCVKNAAGSAIAGSCPSDSRYKRDVRSFASSLDKVVALRPVTYFWRAEAFPEKAFGDSQTYGLIAQEAEAVLPELVSTADQGYKSVDYSRLPLLAIQALKELKARNDDLERRLAVLEAALANPLYGALQAVQNDAVSVVDGAVWTSLGGPLAAQVVLDNVAAAFGAQ